MKLPFQTDPFVAFRYELHRFPELSGQETQTQQRIRAFISLFDPADITPIGGTGLLVRYGTGTGTGGPVTLIRADIDALPIPETNTFAHQSRHERVSHKCGHDGHTAILVRLAASLHASPIATGLVYLLFQPAEETGEGADLVLHDNAFRALRPPDRVFALHNLPGFAEGVIVCKPGLFTASVSGMDIRFTGHVSHAAEPENGNNPAYAMAEFVLQSRALQQPDPQLDTFALITPVQTTMSDWSYGVSPGTGQVHLTLRSRTPARMDDLKKQIGQLLDTLADAHKLVIDSTDVQPFYATENDADAVDQIRNCAETLGFPYQELTQPFRWGEDFGLFTQHFRGAMFGIGAGEDSPALHNDDYDFNDNLIEPAARLFRALIDLKHT
ncbi:amidohydrolase [Spirosoma rhododendri]|uniref:Amidohydrolase n=1 Tax=Spirosoma rhododendri TaxID=2728024 RepID=A0A7L5DRQ4_9BACT|nr:amidohydrolase [Spirosoma rhododendri]QJD79923.1 amidohydrolase [Spirosoma rhododendri]